MRILELYDSENQSYFIGENGQYIASDLRDFIDLLRQPHIEAYEIHSLSLIDYDYYGELGKLSDEEMNKYFWDLVDNFNMPVEKRKEIFELFWRNSDDFWN